jgi:hypothetical protein
MEESDRASARVGGSGRKMAVRRDCGQGLGGAGAGGAGAGWGKKGRRGRG